MPGRGMTCFSRLSVWSSTKPGTRRSPERSSPFREEPEISVIIPSSATRAPFLGPSGVRITAFFRRRRLLFPCVFPKLPAFPGAFPLGSAPSAVSCIQVMVFASFISSFIGPHVRSRLFLKIPPRPGP